MGKKKHRRSKSSPGYANGWIRSDSFDSVIEESPRQDHGEQHSFTCPGIRINEDLKKNKNNKKNESESSEPTVININQVINIKCESLELPQLGVSVNRNEAGDDHDHDHDNNYPIFKPSSPNSHNNFSSSSLPPNFSQSSSSSNSSISLRIPSSHASSASISSTKKTSNSLEDSDQKNSISGENSGGLDSLDNGFEVTFPVSDFGQGQGSFMGRMISLIHTPPLVQAMERSGGGETYDPHRIPSAIFETNKAVEWSVASNESLFSLNLGRTNSLSPEKLFSLGDFRSGELDPMAVYRFAAPRASDADSNCYRASDVEIDMMKRIEEDEVPGSEEKVTENTDLRIIEVYDEGADEIQFSSTDSDSKPETQTAQAPSFRVENLIENISSAKSNKNSDESVKSTSSFAFQVLEDGTPAKDPRRSSIEMQQNGIQNSSYLESPYRPKAKSKSWFSCFSCCCCCCSSNETLLRNSSYIESPYRPKAKSKSSWSDCFSCGGCCGGCSWFSVQCCKPRCKPCCSGDSCSAPCNCSSCSSCSLPSCACNCSWSWCRCFSCSGCSFCCFGSCFRFLSCRSSSCCC